jgi:hypothetical protein
MAPRALAALASALLIGCGSEDAETGASAGPPPPADAGADAGSEGCEPGTRALTDGACLAPGVPADGCGVGFESTGDGACRGVLPEVECDDGQMALLGETSCREVMSCPSGRWGDAADGESTQYVDASYAGTTSDGSEASPWTTIQAAIDAAAPNAAIAVAAGSYAEDLEIAGKAVRLRGRCPGMVEVVGSGAALAAIYVKDGAAGTEISGMAVRGGAMGVLVAGSEEVTLERSWITQTGGWGIDVEDSAGASGLTVNSCLIESTLDAGIIVFGAALSVLDTVVREVKPLGGLYGRGIDIEPGSYSHARAQATLRAVVVSSTRDAGIFVGGSDATIDASLVRDTEVQLSRGIGGYGIWVQHVAAADERGAATITQSVVERSAEAGISIAGADVTIESSVIRDTFGLEDDPQTGMGVIAVHKAATGDRSTVALRSSVVSTSRSIGVYVLASDGVLESSIVRDILPGGPQNPLSGRGIAVESEPDGPRGLLEVRWSLVERVREMGIAVLAADGIIEDTLVRDVEAQVTDGKFGRGINVQIYQDAPHVPASAQVRRCRVERTYEGGVVVLAAQLTMEDTTIVDTRPRPLDQRGGRGVIVQRHPQLDYTADVTLKRCLIQGSHEAGIGVQGGRLLLEDSRVQDTRPSQLDGSLGDALVVQEVLDDGSSITVRRTLLQGSARAGVANFDGSVTISDTTLECNPIHLDGEQVNGGDFTFADEGGNVCGCAGETTPCKVSSSQLSPPPPID